MRIGTTHFLTPDSDLMSREDLTQAMITVTFDVAGWLDLSYHDYFQLLELEGPRIFERARE